VTSAYRICFVCLGNICRSPMAEVVTRALLDKAGLADRIEVSSTGTGDWHVGGPANPGSVRALTSRGYDVSQHRARQLTEPLLADFDLLVALDIANVRDIEHLLDSRPAAEQPEVALLRDFAPGGTPGLDVADPYGQDDAAFDQTLDVVEQACHGLVDHLSERFGHQG